jgi:hypothetical protein
MKRMVNALRKLTCGNTAYAGRALAAATPHCLASMARTENPKAPAERWSRPPTETSTGRQKLAGTTPTALRAAVERSSRSPQVAR